MTEIPTEALEAAARAETLAAVAQITKHTVGCICVRCEDLTAAAPFLIAEGRRQRDQELFTGVLSLNPELTEPDDETLALMARYERELRAKIAGELDAESDRVHGLGGQYNLAVAVGLTAAARMLREEFDPGLLVPPGGQVWVNAPDDGDTESW